MSRITDANLRARVAALNGSMERYGSCVRYALGGESGYTSLDRFNGEPYGDFRGHVIMGSRRDVWEHIGSMLDAISDVRRAAY